jgi:hypothetical protein
LRLGRRLVLITAIIAALGPVAALAVTSPAAYAAANQGWVRCANLSPGTPAEVYLYPFGNPDHPIVLTHEGYGYGGVSDYMPVTAGQYTVAMRPIGAPASSPSSISTSFMVSAGSNYTVASIGSVTARRLEVLQDQMAGAAESKTLVRVIQASLKQPRVTVSVGSDILARQLAFGSASAYQAVQPGTPTVTVSAPGGRAARPVTLAAGSDHTIVVLDGTSGLTIDNVTDEVRSYHAPRGGAATGLGGTALGGMAPDGRGAGLAPWLATLAGGLLLATAGVFGLRRSRRTTAVPRD